MYVQRHPHVQEEVSSEKKTIVILGSGWASTSFLKDIDTDDYNVVVYLAKTCLSFFLTYSRLLYPLVIIFSLLHYFLKLQLVLLIFGQ